MKYWVFKCNPTMYRIDNLLQDHAGQIPFATSWFVDRYKEDIGPGGIAFLWKTSRQGHRGAQIVAVMEVVTIPSPQTASHPQYNISRDMTKALRVNVRITQHVKFLSVAKLLEFEELRDMQPLKSIQKTTFSLTSEEGRIIRNLCQGRDPFAA